MDNYSQKIKNGTVVLHFRSDLILLKLDQSMSSQVLTVVHGADQYYSHFSDGLYICIPIEDWIKAPCTQGGF